MSQPAPQPSWKEEVNRRLEAHKSRRGLSVVDSQQASDEHSNVSSRAAQAAARVAARYAKAPSFSELQASEARAALRAAEAATRVALEAQAAAQAALDQWQSSADVEKTQETHFLADENDSAFEQATPAIEAAVAKAPLEVRWEPDLPQPRSAQQGYRENRVVDAFVADPSAEPGIQEYVPSIEMVEAAEPIPGNVIHFPREIVAARRVRPRLSSETDLAEENGQLSIFEVDPGAICTEPDSAHAELSSTVWNGPEWSGIKLDAQPEVFRPRVQEAARSSAAPSGVHLAPLESRLMAAAVDFALVLGLVCAAVAGLAGHVHGLTLKSAEVDGIAALILTGILYQAFFLLCARTTPGMMYAGISLCTFDDEHPTRSQLRDRLGALLVSVFPVGLGMAWAIFDEDHLSWHDRLSRTYQRKC